MVPMGNEGSNDVEEVKKAPTNNENNSNDYNVVHNSESDDEAMVDYFEEQVNNKVKVTPKTTLDTNL